MKKENEIDALDKFKQLLMTYFRKDITKHKSIYPDEIASVKRRKKEIDCLIYRGIDRIACEHTIIEKYEGQMEYLFNSFDFVTKINRKLKGTLPKDRYYAFIIEPELIIKQSKKTLKDLEAFLICELSRNMSSIEKGQYRNINYKNKGITIMCESDGALANGEVYRFPTTPENVTRLQAKRIRRAFTEKLGKLIKYKLIGCKTALLLEDISGIHGFGINKRFLGLLNYIKILLFIDIIIIFISRNNKMTRAHIWKEKNHWYNGIPINKRFDLKK